MMTDFTARTGSMKYLAILVVGGLTSLTTFARPVLGMSAADRQPQVAKRVKAEIAKLKPGIHTRLEVVLRNDTKVEGYLDRVGTFSFFVTDFENQVSTQVAYASVKQVSTSLSKGAKIGIWVGVGTAAAILVYYVVIVQAFACC